MKDIDIEKVNQGIQYEKYEAALAEADEEDVGEEEQGIWTQTSEDQIIIDEFLITPDKSKQGSGAIEDNKEHSQLKRQRAISKKVSLEENVQ